MNKKREALRIVEMLVSTTVLEAILFNTSNRVIDTLGSVPLVFLLPGAALLGLINSIRKNVSFLERLMWTVLASMGITTVGGLLLNLFGGLTRHNWLIFAAIVVGASGVFQFGELLIHTISHKQKESSATLPQHYDNGSSPTTLTRRNIRGLTILLLALSLVVASLVVSQLNTSATRERFAELWLVPIVNNKVNFESTTPGSARLGVQNFEGRTAHFLVSLFIGKSNIPLKRSLTLQNGAEWSLIVNRPRNTALKATLAIRSGGKSHMQYVTLGSNG
jgi:uncharacterized membrane protein